MQSDIIRSAAEVPPNQATVTRPYGLKKAKGMSSEHTRREYVTIEYEGESYAGSYTTSDGMVHVSWNTGLKSAPIGATPPVVLARSMIRELVQEEQSKKSL
jgi:hypothetical protein